MACSSIKTKKKKIGNRFEVYSGIAQETRSGLTKLNLKKYDGVIYSKRELEIKKERNKATKQKKREKIKIQQSKVVQKPKRLKLPKKLSWADIMDELNE